MAELIPSSWDADTAKRPSFEEVFGLIQNSYVAIIPDGRPIGIREYCRSAVAWEDGKAVRR
jgi:hypothetical protein